MNNYSFNIELITIVLTGLQYCINCFRNCIYY